MTTKDYNILEGDIVKKVNKKTAFGGGIALAGATQFSRNKKIRAVGGFALYAVVMGAIGELLGFLIKWIIWKPIVLVAKGFYHLFVWTFKAIYYYPIMYGYKGIVKLYNYLKIKYKTKKAI